MRRFSGIWSRLLEFGCWFCENNWHPESVISEKIEINDSAETIFEDIFMDWKIMGSKQLYEKPGKEQVDFSWKFSV
jgi:hypothetical protein